MICLLSALCAPASLVSQVRNIEYDPRDMPADERFGGVAAHRPGGGLTPVRDEYDVSIRIGYETGGGYSPNYIEAYLGTFGDTLSWSSGTPSMSGTTTLEPYERYDLWIRSDDPIRFFMLFSPPAGFEIEFERTRTDYARATLDGSDLWNRFDVRLVPTGGASSGGARLGETLVLEFPLGTLPGGEPLGSVTLTQEGPGAALFDRSSLRFFSEHPAVTVYESGGALGLIEAPKYVLVFSDHNDGFSVQYSARVYDQNWGDYIYGAKVKDYLVEPVGTGNDKVRVIERRTSAAGTYEVRRTEYQWNTGVGWNILYDSSARRNLITNYTSTDDYGGSRSEEVTVQDSGTTVGTKYRRAFKNFGSEEYLFKQIRLIDGDEWVTEYDYYTSGTGAAEVAGMIRSVKYADGGWIKYEYSDFGDGGAPRVSKMVKPFENSVFPTSGDGSNTEVTTMSWTSGYDGINSFPATTEVRIGGTLVSKTDNTYIFENSGSEITMEAKDGGGSTRSLYLRETTAYANSSSSIVTKAAYYKGRTGPDGDDPYLANRPVYILEASGSMTFYDYDFGHTFLDTDGRYDGFTPWWSLNKRGWRVIEYSGVNPSFSGSGYGSLSLGITNSPSGWPTSMKLVPGKSTKTVQIWDGRGMLSRTETYVYTTSDWSPTPVAWTDFLYNRNLELETVYQSDFTDGSNDLAVIQREYDNQGRLTAEVGADGSRVEYTYDSLDQVQTQTNVGRATAFTPVSGGPSVALPDVTTTYFYDPAGRVKETRRGTSTEYISNKWGYFESGDLEYEENEFGVRTRYDYDNSTGRKSVTTYRVDIDEDDLPGSGTTTTFYRDGRKEKIEGCGSCGGIDQYFHFEIPATYQRRSTTYKGVNYGPRYSETTIDGLGRTTRQERASFDSDHDQTPGEEYVQQVYTYNGSTGLLTKLQETGVADRLFEYDHFGRMSRSGLNVGGGTTLANGSSDRIEATDWQYLYADDSWWMETKREMPVITSTGANSSSVQVVSLERQRLTGKAAYTLSEAFAEDAFGNRTWTRQIVTPANRELRGYVDVPDAGSTQSTTGSPQYDSYSITVAGRPVASMGADGAFKVTNRFDAQGRIREQYDSHAGYVRTDYEDYKNNASYYGVTTMPVSIYEAQNSSHFSAAGKILTKLTYDSMGRLSVEESLENTGPDVYVATRRSFDAYDRVTKVWGHVPYPVEYNYHSVYGHKEKMKTYRAGSGWSASTWPGSPGTADVTTFEVDPQSGLLWKRIDGDTSGDTTEHIYDLRGNRTLLNQANGKSIKFTYSGSTSELTAIDYGNNGSNEESFVYNRLGSLNSITDASGTRSFRFSFISGFPYVSREILGSFYNAPSSVSRSLYNDVFDASNPPSTGDAYGKSRRMRLVSGSTDDLIYLYDYDSYGRIDTITYNAGSHAQLQIDYNFWANSSLPSTRLIKRSGLTRVWSEHSWDDNRYQLNEVETRLFSSTGPVMAQHYYTYNELGKRTAEFKRGYAFNHYGVNGIAREYEYNSRGELTSAIDYLDNSSTIGTLNFSTATVVNGRRWSYNFDNQGNRSGADGRKFFFDSSSDSSETYYTAAYNEFTWIARTVDRSVSGSSSASSIQARGRTTDSWVSADIQGDHYWKAFQYTVPFDGHIIEERQARNGSTSAILSSEKEVITDAWDQIIYDASGNMTQDDLWWYTYDEANRLVKMDSKMATDLGKHETLVFACDYMGRRIRKEHWTSDNFSTNWVKVDEERYVYNGWNVVAIVEADGSYRRRLAWGLDVSGSGQGAGGVGGLVGIFDDEDGREYSPIYDGNGNVTGIVDLISQQLDAEYEYSPFGETIRSEGSYEAENHYRFSTKEVDLESKLYYYGLRYYAPRLGRFVNRDPIQEAGGQNLYGFVRNDPVNGTEFLGLCGVETFYYSTWECTGPLECAVVGRSFRVVTGCDDLFKIDREGPDFRYDSESSSAELPSKRGGPLCRNGGKTLPSYPTIPQLESFLGDDTNIGSNDGLTPAHFRGIMNNPAFDWANRGTREVSVFVGVYSGANVGGLARAAGPFLWDVGSKTAIGTWEFAKDGYALTSGAVGWATSAVVGKGIQTSASLTTRYSGEQLIGMAEIGLSVAGGAVMAWKDDDVSIDGFVPGTDPSQSARNQVGGFVGGVSSLAVKQVFGRLGDLGSDGDEDEDETEGGDCGE